ncbi:MAG: putative NodU family carbamoyl transferase [Myxococcota bacterium]
MDRFEEDGMHILGVADGLDAGAALVEDDRLVAVAHQARLDRTPRSRAFPWDAIDEVLRIGGISASEVDRIAVAGKFTPPLALRRDPRLHRAVRNPFSPALDAGVFYQAVLQQTGFGAMDADRTAELLEQRFSERGFAPGRVVLVDIHAALANGAYRTQDHDPLTVFSLHPMGDGKAAAVYRGTAGQVDRIWEQRGFSSLHVHLQRCCAAIGLSWATEHQRLWALAARGKPSRELLKLLHEQLHAEGPRLSRRRYPWPARMQDRVYRALADAPAPDAAASVLTNLERAIVAWVAHHVAGTPGSVALVGAVFDNPRLVASVAALEDVRGIWVPPEPGFGLLAVGAALYRAGATGASLDAPLLLEPPADAIAACLPRATPMDDADLAAIMADAGVVGRYVGRRGLGSHGAGSRSVLARADRSSAVAAARAAVGRAGDEEPLLVLRSSALGTVGETLAIAERHGVAAPALRTLARKFPGAATADGRVLLHVVRPGDDLDHLLAALEAQTGCSGIAALPLGLGDSPPASTVAEAARVWASSELDALRVGDLGVRRLP